MSEYTTIDPEKQKQAREYARTSRRMWLVQTVLSLLYTSAWIFTGWGVGLRSWLNGFISNDWLLVPAFILIYGGISTILDLPLSYYTGFVLPHRYNQSTQTQKAWILDQLKELLVMVPIGLLILELLYLALRAAGMMWWLWAAGGLLIFQVLLVNLAPVLIMPLFNKYVPLGDEHAELKTRLLQLAEKSGTKVQGVYTFDLSRRTKAANAALTGLGNTRRIILGDTLLNEFSGDEIETVLAHELGHQVNNDIPLLIGFGALTTTVGLFLASLVMHLAVDSFNYTGVADPAAFPALTLVFSLYGLLTMPLQNGFSRWRESLADRYALQSTGKSEAFASAIARLANQNLGETNPEKWVVFLFHSHPPLGERIRMAKGWKTG